MAAVRKDEPDFPAGTTNARHGRQFKSRSGPVASWFLA
jgi:hypothetical protein